MLVLIILAYYAAIATSDILFSSCISQRKKNWEAVLKKDGFIKKDGTTTQMLMFCVTKKYPEFKDEMKIFFPGIDLPVVKRKIKLEDYGIEVKRQPFCKFKKNKTNIRKTLKLKKI